jgi:hypothetical protein
VRGSKRNIRSARIILALVLSGLMTSSDANAQAVPKVGTCPSGYHTSGHMASGKGQTIPKYSRSDW